MANEEQEKSTCEVLQSVEIDAAPSVEFVHLASLDIGSECTVETESKTGSKKFVSDTVAVQEEDETEPSSQSNDGNAPAEQETGRAEQEIDRAEQETDRNLEVGVGSLNLEESLKPEVTVTDDEELPVLLHQDPDGDTLLHIAIILLWENMTLHLINIMEENELFLDAPNRLQQTALHLAVLTGQMEVVKALLLARASPFARDHQLRTPISIACEKNDMPLFGEMIQSADWGSTRHGFTSSLLNPDIHPLNLPNADGERCLHLAVKHNNVIMARQLIANGADPNFPDRRSGRTPLHVAADLGLTEMVRFLISVEDIDINQRTYNEETALEIAHMRERPEVVVLLKPLSFPVMKRKTKNDLSTG